MPHVFPTYAVQLELSGAGGGWTDVSADIVGPLTLRYGLGGNGPLARVADTGTCTFALNNSASNSASTLGYYSPLHGSVRSGFTFGIGVRVAFTYSGTTYYKFRGKLKEIAPVPGINLQRLTLCLAVDWMEEAAEATPRDLTLQLSKRSDEVVSAILAAITTQPAATSIATGQDTYTYALDNLGGGTPSALALLQDVAQSELGLIYVMGDTTQGGTFVFENRHTRMATTTNAVTIDGTMVGLDVPRSLSAIYNRVETVIAPRRVDAAATTVLYAMPVPSVATITAGSSITIWGDYRDPAQEAVFVGGTAMVNPVATTDYTMNTASDGSGTDLTADFTVTPTFFGSTVKLVVANGHASSAGYITKLQCRGKGIYRYAPVTYRGDNTSSQTARGLRQLPVPMPYQDSGSVAQGAADYLANLYGDPATQVNAVRFVANRDSTHLTAALAQEISSRIGLEEEVTGVTSVLSGGTRGWYIQSVQFDVQPAGNSKALIVCTWGLSPASQSGFWIMDTSALDVDTVLAYV